MSSQNHISTTTKFFGAIGALGVISGGVLSAFSAHQPTEYAMWASAYLVLVVGVLQIGLALGLHYGVKQSLGKAAILAFVFYNAGNMGVLLGNYLKDTNASGLRVINTGGFFLALSMALILYAARNAQRSRVLIAFYVVVAIVMVSMPIGLILAHR